MGFRLFLILIIISMGSSFLFCNPGKNKDAGSGLMWMNPSEKNEIAGLIPRVPSPCNADDPTEDPLFPYQWHLHNTAQPMFHPSLSTGIPGEDINVLPVWGAKNFGQSVLVSIIDDGVDIDHEDLRENITDGSRNFSRDNGLAINNPGGITASHGTAVAGIIGARAQNNKGGTGVAPCAHMIGFNFLTVPTTTNLSQALSGNLSVAISNNSWGSEDGTGRLYTPLNVWRDSIAEGISNGRNGLGVVYVWAAGNGGAPGGSPSLPVDNANYDGYSNKESTITVAAITNQGNRATYSERGGNIWVTSYSGESGNTSITTTDLTGDNWGYNPGGVSPGVNVSPATNYTNTAYTNTFNGTSASTPSVSGVIALLLRQYPGLTYRDVKLILARSARKSQPGHSGWTTNSAGILHNDLFGFGLVDASLAMQEASTWASIGGKASQKIFSPSAGYTTGSIASGTTENFSVNIGGSQITKIEYIEITVNLTSSNPGKIQIDLVSPHAPQVSSTLHEEHYCYSGKNRTLPLRQCDPIAEFVFGTAKFLEEPADGNWTLRIQDKGSGGSNTLNSWNLRFYGR